MKKRVHLILSIWLVVCLAAITGLRFYWRNSLPDPVAIHFSFGGQANGYASLWVDAAVMSAAVVVAAALLWLLMLGRGIAYTRATRWLTILLIWLMTFLAMMSSFIVAGQVGLADAHDATFGPVKVLAAIGLSLLIAAAVSFVLPQAEPDVEAAPTPALALSAAEKISWHAGETSVVVVVVGIVFVAISVVLFFLNITVGGIVAVLVGLLIPMLCGSVRLAINDNGVRWQLGIGLIRGHIRLDHLVSATASQINPMEYGGWGIRISQHGWGIIMRRGEGITFKRANKIGITFTVPDAENGAAAVNGLLARASKH